MAKSTKSKVPLRGISSLFNHLNSGVKAQIESAFAEAEDLMDYHNRSVVDQQERRALSGLVAQPQVEIHTNQRGIEVRWDRLEDRRISQYDVQVSFSSNFSNPDTYKVVNTNFSLEGIGTAVYVRVRGVRFDGDCGPWSDTVTADVSATGGPVVYSRGLDDVPSFYVASLATLGGTTTIQHLTITPQKSNGGIMVFGSICGGGGVGQSVRMTINDQTLTESTYTTSTGIGLGPVFLTHDQFYFSTSDNFSPNTADESGSSSGSGVHTGWTNVADVTGVMETVYPSPVFDGAASYSVTGLSAGQSGISKDLNLSNFGFTVSSGSTITGIQVVFTGSATSSGLDNTKSYPQLNRIRLLDGGVTRTYSHTTNTAWPNDNPETIGATIASVTFGGEGDLWGEADGFWTPSKINSSGFGSNLRARIRKASSDTTGGTGSAVTYIFGMEITVFSQNPNSNEVRVDIRYVVAPSGVLRNCTLNVIEFGEDIVQ